MALFYPDIVKSSNPNAYGIVDAKEVTGAKVVQTYNALSDIADAILSPSKTNENDDALGQIWYVSEVSSSYRLANWDERKNIDIGWEKLAISQTDVTSTISSGISSIVNEVETISKINNDMYALTLDMTSLEGEDATVGDYFDKLSSCMASMLNVYDTHLSD